MNPSLRVREVWKNFIFILPPLSRGVKPYHYEKKEISKVSLEQLGLVLSCFVLFEFFVPFLFAVTFFSLK